MTHAYYTAKDIMRILKVPRAKAYLMMEQMDRVKIGQCVRVSESTLARFLDSDDPRKDLI